MASVSFTQFPVMHRLWGWSLNRNTFPYTNFVGIQDCRANKHVVMAVSRKKTSDSLGEDVSNEEEGSAAKKSGRTSKRASSRTKKKAPEIPGESSAANGNGGGDEISLSSSSTETPKKTRTRTRKKASSTSEAVEGETTEKVTRRRRSKKKVDDMESHGSEAEVSDWEGGGFDLPMDEDSEEELEIDIDEGEDISYTYGWPPLVCCFGAAQHAFIPAGRRANRIIDYEIHERMKDVLWEPEKFVRSPGGCASNVAVALASLGGKVAFMGKLGDDDFGDSLLYFLNINKVQTRSVRIDDKRSTAISMMKISKRGGLKMTAVKPCAEDCLSKSEINIDVLKEAEMFYFNTFSLLDPNMRSTLLRAIKIAKKLGNVVFYDLNLPMPLWQSSEETKAFIRTAWNLSDIIEVTKQEFEFLSGITPEDDFDTKDNRKSKFIHYAPDVVSKLWHDNLKIFFITNGTSKIHYYTKEHDGAVNGMEDAPITPYTSDMSASGDGIVAGLMRMLSVQPHLLSDKGYLEHTVNYALNCGVIDQWLQARQLGYPAKEGMEDVEADPHGIRSITEKEYRTLVPEKE
ncbi:fructokinase-like 2, chloroplastic [Andrographis paniculata]|uniref:fructokinase-like 2, chloroplastic n=1 Tax=Andrographis paniculata TaxID=175694 RepID=UPI0021E93FDB|nr:fructokinase-like 2, chloroplastic [Andrographis paniculata]